MVCSGASTSTVRPCSRAVAAVTGPMQATTGERPFPAEGLEKRSTVELDVKVMTSAAATADRCWSVMAAGTVR